MHVFYGFGGEYGGYKKWGFFEGKSWEFDEMCSFIGGDKKGGKGAYRGPKKSSGEVFGKRF